MRHPATPLAGPPRIPAKPARPRRTEQADTPPSSTDPLTIPPNDVWVAAATGTPPASDAAARVVGAGTNEIDGPTHVEQPTPPAHEHAPDRTADNVAFWTNATDRPIPDPHGNGVRIGEADTPAPYEPSDAAYCHTHHTAECAPTHPHLSPRHLRTPLARPMKPPAPSRVHAPQPRTRTARPRPAGSLWRRRLDGTTLSSTQSGSHHPPPETNTVAVVAYRWRTLALRASRR